MRVELAFSTNPVRGRAWLPGSRHAAHAERRRGDAYRSDLLPGVWAGVERSCLCARAMVPAYSSAIHQRRFPVLDRVGWLETLVECDELPSMGL